MGVYFYLCVVEVSSPLCCYFYYGPRGSIFIDILPIAKARGFPQLDGDAPPRKYVFIAYTSSIFSYSKS
jgi:hypothetical protein